MIKIEINPDQGIGRLKPIIDLILENGNQLVLIEAEKLGTVNMFIKNPIDATLLQENFDFPKCIIMDEDPNYGIIVRDIKNSFNISSLRKVRS